MSPTRPIVSPPRSFIGVPASDERTPSSLPSSGSGPDALAADPARPELPRPSIGLDHRLPVHKNKVERVTGHLAELSEDLREWVELRVQLIRKEIEEKIEGRLSSVKGIVAFGVAGAVTGLFALVTLAIGLGAAFGGRYWLGFLVVTALLAVTTYVVKRKMAPGAIHIEHEKSTGKLKITHDETPADHEKRQALSR